ncbi:MAG TPA: flagellar motor stator protein MotA [Acetobacteraceae bacterium]|nr:flagellar motor stator protein MotA [Acetobacteraceae bacterium]
MWQGIGLVGVFVVVWLGYTISGGKFGVILQAAGPELLVIGGAGTMTLLISNDTSTVKKVWDGLRKVFSGPKWKKTDYADALCLMFLLVRVARQEGNVALERHIENPEKSAIFAHYPHFLADKDLTAFISDVFRSITLNFTDAYKVGEMMETEVAKRYQEQLRAAKALSTVADAFPALGIVAAVLGIIKAMGAISESPQVLGHMISSALVGTFLGVFLSYALVGPLAGRIRNVVDEENAMPNLIRQIITSHLDNLVPQLAVEVGRKSIPSKFQPSFNEMDGMLKEAAKVARKGEG